MNALSPLTKQAIAALPPDLQQQYWADLEKRFKSFNTAQAAWFFLGWHYLYLGNILMQFAFWFTGGFFVIGWFVDFFRIRGLVDKANEEIARNLLKDYRLMTPASAPFAPAPPRPPAPPQERFFCFLNDQVIGPFDRATLQQMTLPAETPICPEGSEEWTRYRDV